MSRTLTVRVASIAAVALLLVAPVLLRPRLPQEASEATLIIVSPHDAQTRLEFGHAFAEWAARELHQTVSIDWRTPGGTKVIQRQIADRTLSNLANAHRDWTSEQLKACADAKTDASASAATPAQREARASFLASDIGCDMDLWWGGGAPAHREFAEAGYSVDAGLIRDEPGWFRDEIIPAKLTGDEVYDPKGRWYGTALSAFGICSSPDRLALLTPSDAPASWSDLGEPRLFDQVTMVDPSKSAASLSALLMLIQQRMGQEVAAAKAAGGDEASGLTRGWDSSFALIKRIAGNCRAITDGASTAVREVVRGETTAAMAIDFQARAEAAFAITQSGGTARMRFIAPVGGTSVSADPISLLRGAPSRTLAVAFIRFVLSPEGQRLYSYKVGVPGGPQHWELYRAAVRRDVYTDADRQRMTDPALDPFAIAGSFEFHEKWTGKWYGLIGPLTRAVVLDPQQELVAAWRAILRAGGPEQAPAAWHEFTWLPFAYAEGPAMSDRLRKDPVQALVLTRTWTVEAQRHYREAERLAGESMIRTAGAGR